MDDNRKCDDPGSRTEASGWFCGGVFSLLPTDLRKEQRKETSTLKQQQQTHTVCNQYNYIDYCSKIEQYWTENLSLLSILCLPEAAYI